MALIRNFAGREDGGYTRVVGDPLLGKLFSRVHSTVIASGNELEKLIQDRVQTLPDLDDFLDWTDYPKRIFLAPKTTIKRSKKIDTDGAEPDFVVFDAARHHCHIIELKDGDAFDTKKAAGELASMEKFRTHFSPYIRFSVSIHFCCFHARDRKAVIEAFKRRITDEQAMNGKEFCDLLTIDYDEILALRTQHQRENLAFVAAELLQIDALRPMFAEILADGGKLHPANAGTQLGLLD